MSDEEVLLWLHLLVAGGKERERPRATTKMLEKILEDSNFSLQIVFSSTRSRQIAINSNQSLHLATLKSTNVLL